MGLCKMYDWPTIGYTLYTPINENTVESYRTSCLCTGRLRSSIPLFSLVNPPCFKKMAGAANRSNTHLHNGICYATVSRFPSSQKSGNATSAARRWTNPTHPSHFQPTYGTFTAGFVQPAPLIREKIGVRYSTILAREKLGGGRFRRKRPPPSFYRVNIFEERRTNFSRMRGAG